MFPLARGGLCGKFGQKFPRAAAKYIAGMPDNGGTEEKRLIGIGMLIMLALYVAATVILHFAGIDTNDFCNESTDSGPHRYNYENGTWEPEGGWSSKFKGNGAA